MEPENNAVDDVTASLLQENADLFDGALKDAFVNLLNNEKFRKRVVDLVNENVNLPILSESIEEKLFTQAYDWVSLAIIAALDKID